MVVGGGGRTLLLRDVFESEVFAYDSSGFLRVWVPL